MKKGLMTNHTPYHSGVSRSRLSILTLILLMLLQGTACSKRYEDGPCISFIKAENRITGLWRVEQFLLDGVADESAGFRDTVGVMQFSFFRNPENALFVKMNDTSGTVLAESLIRYDDRMVYMNFGLIALEGREIQTAPVFSLLPALSQENRWQINRLKRKEMWIFTTFGAQMHEIRFSLIIDYDAS